MEPNDFEKLFGEGGEQKHERMVEQLTEAAKDCGLYLDYARVLPPDPGGTRLTVQSQFTIGDMAWRPKVQDPEQHDFDKQFQGMAGDLEDDTIRELREKFEKGELPWQKDV